MTTTNPSDAYTPDDDIQIHREKAIELLCKPFQSHEAGLPEWAKNSADEYARDNADEADRVIVLLFQNGRANGPSTVIACLDFSGMTSEVIENDFRHWADPDASQRGDRDGTAAIQGGHGNGGKCYMTQMFSDRSYLFTVREGRGNVYGTMQGSIRLGYFPDRETGKDFPAPDVRAALTTALGELGIGLDELPKTALDALDKRQGFTLTVGRGAKTYTSRVPAAQIVGDLAEHPQMRMTIELCSVYVVANHKPFNDGSPLVLPDIPPLLGWEEAWHVPIPSVLVDPQSGADVSTTDGGTLPEGELILRTSDTRMWRGGKKSRHNVVYKAQSGYIGYRPVADFDVASSFRERIYGDCALMGLEPAKLNDRASLATSPLVRAVENWIGEEIERYAKEIEARDRRKHDQEEKDALALINDALDSWKNDLLDRVLGDGDGPGKDPGKNPPPPPPTLPKGTPARIELSLSFYRAGVGIAMRPRLSAFDSSDKPIRPPAVTWTSDNPQVASVDDTIRVIETFAPGHAVLRCETFDKQITSNSVSLEVVDIIAIDLVPDSIELDAGSRRRIVATCTLASGDEATDVALSWIENDPSIATVSASGAVFGLSVGNTDITAGDDRVTANNSVSVQVGPGDGDGDSGSGYPRVLISEINLDPDTGESVVLSTDDPPVHQRVQDVERNIWWINSASPLARLYLTEGYGPESREWRIYHLERYIDVIVQITMSQGPEADDQMDSNEWMARWGERAADIQAAAASGLAAFIKEGELPQ